LENNEINLDSHYLSQVKCSKCGAMNVSNARRCSQCHMHLFLYCTHCHHKNPRSETICSSCGKEVRQKSWWSMNRKYFRKFVREKLPLRKPIFLLIIIILGIFISWFIIRFYNSWIMTINHFSDSNRIEFANNSVFFASKSFYPKMSACRHFLSRKSVVDLGRM